MKSRWVLIGLALNLISLGLWAAAPASSQPFIQTVICYKALQTAFDESKTPQTPKIKSPTHGTGSPLDAVMIPGPNNTMLLVTKNDISEFCLNRPAGTQLIKAWGGGPWTPDQHAEQSCPAPQLSSNPYWILLPAQDTSKPNSCAYFVMDPSGNFSQVTLPKVNNTCSKNPPSPVPTNAVPIQNMNSKIGKTTQDAIDQYLSLQMGQLTNNFQAAYQASPPPAKNAPNSQLRMMAYLDNSTTSCNLYAGDPNHPVAQRDSNVKKSALYAEILHANKLMNQAQNFVPTQPDSGHSNPANPAPLIPRNLADVPGDAPPQPPAN